MKKKLITLVLCGVIGGASIAGVSIYENSQGTKYSQTLEKAANTIEKTPTIDEEEEKINNMSEGTEEATDNKNGQANSNSENGQANSNNETDVKFNSPSTETQKAVNDGQGSSRSQEEQNSESISNGKKDNLITNDSYNYNNNENSSSNSEDSSNNESTNGENSNSGESNGSVNPPSQESTDGSFYDQVEQLIFNKVNEERSKAGLPSLSYNSTMETYARIKSKDMGVRNYFDHVNPDGEMITAQMARDGVSYNAWGENIAYISGVSDATAIANQFMTNWMNSSGHRANILSPNFTSIGVGVYKSGNKYYATQEFYK